MNRINVVLRKPTPDLKVTLFENLSIKFFVITPWLLFLIRFQSNFLIQKWLEHVFNRKQIPNYLNFTFFQTNYCSQLNLTLRTVTCWKYKAHYLTYIPVPIFNKNQIFQGYREDWKYPCSWHPRTLCGFSPSHKLSKIVNTVQQKTPCWFADEPFSHIQYTACIYKV